MASLSVPFPMSVLQAAGTPCGSLLPSFFPIPCSALRFRPTVMRILLFCCASLRSIFPLCCALLRSILPLCCVLLRGILALCRVPLRSILVLCRVLLRGILALCRAVLRDAAFCFDFCILLGIQPQHRINDIRLFHCRKSFYPPCFCNLLQIMHCQRFIFFSYHFFLSFLRTLFAHVEFVSSARRHKSRD